MCGFSDDQTSKSVEEAEALEQPQPDEEQADAGADEHVIIGRAELEALQKRAEEGDQYLDMLQRARADLSNYQKRARKEMDSRRGETVQGVALDLLPILDDFARAIASVGGDPRPEDYQAFADGVRMIEEQLYKALAQHKIEPIDAKGQPFDPTYHEAVMQQPSEEHEPGTVMEELRRGFVIEDRVLRASQVIVAAAPPEPETDGSS